MDPVNFTNVRYPDRIVSEARSVKVTIPQSTTLVAGECFYVAPYLGVAMESATNGIGVTKDIALALGPIVVATSKLTSGQTFAVKTKVYWDESTQLFTETPGDIPAGWVYKAKGSESTPVAHIFLQGPRFEPVDLTDAALVVDGLKAAELSLLAGLEEQDHLADVAATGETTVAAVEGVDAAALVTDINKDGGVVDVLNVTRTKVDALVTAINAIHGKLEALGLVATE